MRKLFAVVTCFSLCTVFALAQGGAGKGGAKIEGTWTVTGLTFGEKKLPAEILEKIMPKFTFKEGKYTTSVMGKQDEAGSYKLNAKMKPAHIDLIIEEGKDKGKTQLGLFAFDGDVLKLALAKPGETDRPKNFEPGENVIISTLKKSK